MDYINNSILHLNLKLNGVRTYDIYTEMGSI